MIVGHNVSIAGNYKPRAQGLLPSFLRNIAKKLIKKILKRRSFALKRFKKPFHGITCLHDLDRADVDYSRTGLFGQLGELREGSPSKRTSIEGNEEGTEDSSGPNDVFEHFFLRYLFVCAHL
jgi:hypothetical protein